jgi:hypothetical protein
MREIVVPEVDVLIAASLWLWHLKALPVQFSIATGQGIDSKGDQDRLVKALDSAGVPSKLRSFVSSGPDIVAISSSRAWQVECKGAGAGKQPTQRNNFDRAVASVVSYYTDTSPIDIPELRDATPTLGLAFPGTRDYLALAKTQLPLALRGRLNIWLLIYEPSSSTIRPIEPNQVLS